MRCPYTVKVVPVSTTAKPVTVTADVEVKTLCTQEMGTCVAIGSLSKQVPSAMSKRKPPHKISGGAAAILPDAFGFRSKGLILGCHCSILDQPRGQVL